MLYFEFEKVMKILAANRKKLVSIEIDKKDGTPRSLVGILCFNEARNNYMVSEGTLEDPDFKNLNYTRIKKIRTQDAVYTPSKKRNRKTKQELQNLTGV